MKTDSLFIEPCIAKCRCGNAIHKFKIKDLDNKKEEYKIDNSLQIFKRNKFPFKVKKSSKWENINLTDTLKIDLKCNKCQPTKLVISIIQGLIIFFWNRIRRFNE